LTSSHNTEAVEPERYDFQKKKKNGRRKMTCPPTGTLLITGANGTIATAAIRHILAKPVLASTQFGLYTVRKKETATALQAALRPAEQSGHRHDTIELDLSSLEDVRKVARQINARVASGEIPRIRALVLNAGFEEFMTQTNTVDGFDMTFQVNYLAQWLMALLLLQSMDKEHGRIMTISSLAHKYAPHLSPSAVPRPTHQDKFGLD
jgi:NAD(P)-dependent dehydrogenase (short-subunit alcohol dehydrogenase family)